MRAVFLLAVLMGVGAASAKDLTTLEGDTFREVRVTEVTPYTLGFLHAGGAATIPLASLPESDLAAYGPKADRSQDARFWYERKLALFHGWQRRGGAATGQTAEQAVSAVNPRAALIAPYEQQLAEAEEQRAALAATQAKALAERQAHDEEERRLAEAKSRAVADAKEAQRKKDRPKQAARRRVAREKAEAELDRAEGSGLLTPTRPVDLFSSREDMLRAALRERYLERRTEELLQKGK